MGLFSFFKRRKKRQQETEEETRARLQAMFDEMRAQNRETVNLKGVDEVKPNRFGNYMFVPEATYYVRGTNTATNRRKRQEYAAGSEAEAIQQAEADGLIAPYEVEVILQGEPTERQLAYAKDLGIQIPKGACGSDVSALISRVEDEDEEQASPELLTFLATRGWRWSSFTGYKFARKAIYNVVTTPREQIALYPYYIDRAEQKLPLGNFDTAPRKDLYFAFADYVLQNPKAQEHYNSWRMDRSWPTAKTWGIYKDYKAFCAEKV